MKDLISRQDAIDAIKKSRFLVDAMEKVIKLPPAQSEEIGYAECADAMLKMWIDNVLTDGEYNRIMDKLNEHWGKVNA